MVKFKEQQDEAEARKRKLSMDEPPEAKVPKGAEGALVEEVSGQEGIPDIEFIEEPPGTAADLLDDGMGEERGVEEQAQVMDISSLQLFSLSKHGLCHPCLRESSWLETQQMLSDDFIEQQQIKLQLGSLSLYDAYGIDQTGQKPVVVEVFSPPRLTAFGHNKGLIAGVALDLRTCDHEGIPWDFTQASRRQAAHLLVDELQPELLVGCPPCGPFSILQGLNQRFADTWDNVQKLAEAKEHLAFCCELYRKQMSRKKYFLREHPFLATSWNEDPMKQLEELDTVYKVRGDMCQFGMQAEDEHGVGAVKKPSGFMTNSECIAEQLNVLCKNVNNELKVWKRVDFNANKLQLLKKGGPAWRQVVRRVTMDLNTNEVLQDLQDFQQATRSQLHQKLSGQPRDIVTIFYYKDDNSQWHRHVQLIGGKAKQAEIYPDGLLQRILKGLKQQMQKKSPLSSLEFGPVNEEPYFDQTVLDEEDWTTFIDEVSGKALETGKVRAARAEEIDYATRYNVWTLVPTQEAWDVTGAGPIGSRWIDINKGDVEHPNYRSRLVIQEVRHSGVEAIFAATPPLESIRVLLSLQRSGKQGYKVMFTDIRRAHWTAKIERTVYVRLPPEAAEEGYCGRLNKAMYGCRDAARQWEIEITDFFTSQGFTPGLGSPVLYFHSVRDIKISVHGDDITSLGRKDDLLWLKKQLLTRYEIKDGGMLGPDEGDVQDAMILNRLVHYGPRETTIEADPRHVQILVKELNLTESKSAPTAGVKRSEQKEEMLTPEESSRFRSLTMRGCYLALDRPDIAFACKELARAMAKPCRSDWNGLKRLVRYLHGAPRLIWKYPEQLAQEHFTMYTDNDDAGCSKTRKSTSCGALTHGSHLLKFYSSTQHVISLSSGESEFYAGVKAGSTLLGAMSMALDFGETKRGRLCFDATAAKAMLSRKGHGRAKHIDRSFLWLQQRVQNQELELSKVGTRKNIADLGTKHLDRLQVEALLQEMNLEYELNEHRMTLHV